MNISELKNIYQQKLDKVLSKKQQYLDKVEYYKEKIDNIEREYKEGKFSNKEKNTKIKQYQDKIALSIQQANEYLETKKQQLQDWLDSKINGYTENEKSLQNIQKQSLENSKTRYIPMMRVLIYPSRINMLIGFNLNMSFLFRKSPLKNTLNWKGMVYV